MQTLNRMRTAEKEIIPGRVQNKTDPTVTDSGDNGCRSTPKSTVISSVELDDHSMSRSTESNERNNVTSRFRGSTTSSVIPDKSIRTHRKKGQSNRGKSRGRGRGTATGSIPSEPVEVIKSTSGKDRRDWHRVVLSESSSSSESEDENTK